MVLSRSRISGGLLTGRSETGFGNWQSWDNVPLNYLVASSFNPEQPFAWGDEVIALMAFNRTNPSRHEVLLPAIVLELRDLPKMLRFSGRVLSAGRHIARDLIRGAYNFFTGNSGKRNLKSFTQREIELLRAARLHPDQQGGLSTVKALAAANLAWQFGWKPLIGDISKMIGFQQAFNRRRNEINRLYSGRGLKRRVKLQNYDKVETLRGVIVHSSAGIVTTNATVRAQTKIWCVTRWKPRGRIDGPPADWQIAQNMLGLDVHGLSASAWEILPWSWCIDWFSNMGDFLDISSNSMNASLTGMTIMKYKARTTEFQTAIYRIPGRDKFVSPYENLYEVMTRKVGGFPGIESIAVGLPILSTNQISILSSIAMLRGKR